MAKRLDGAAITKQLKKRLKEQLKQHQQLVDELERLRDSLSDLEGEVRSRMNATRGGRQSTATPTNARPKRSPTSDKAAAAPKRASKSKAVGARAPRGQNKTKILKALEAGPMTASEIAQKTGVATPTVSTMLSRLVRSGELVKAERGYALPG